MPIKDFKCSQCGHTQEVFYKASEDIACPECGGSMVAKPCSTYIKFKGQGWESNSKLFTQTPSEVKSDGGGIHHYKD